MQQKPKPLIVTFRQLCFSLQALHHWQKTHVDTLHDVWMRGAPSPRSRVQNPKGYDPRKQQEGNYEARIVLPTMLTKWIQERTTALGLQIDTTQTLHLIDRLRLGLGGNINDFIQK